MKINENIAQAKSILNKLGISQHDKDYLKIREICKDSLGYVGILTRLRFIDNVSDMDELSSIFDVLKSSRMDIGKLSKMSYEDILNEFWNTLHENDGSGYELILDDGYYSYYEVSTYEGILSIGSPAWCLKTKSNWIAYTSKYEKQYVIIDNKFRGKLLTPNSKNLFTDKYQNDRNPSVRFGVSCSKSRFVMYDDNDTNIQLPDKQFDMDVKAFGVLYTCSNLVNGLIYPYFKGIVNTFTPVKNSEWLQVSNPSSHSKRFFGIDNNIEVTFLMFEKPYSKGICEIYNGVVPKGGVGIPMPYLASNMEKDPPININDGIVKILEDKFKYFLPNKFNRYSESFLNSLNKVDENEHWVSFQVNGRYIICRKNDGGDIHLGRWKESIKSYYYDGVPLFVVLNMDGTPLNEILVSNDVDSDDVRRSYTEIVNKIKSDYKAKNQEPPKVEKKIKRWWEF
jgi:hypothetical protein